MLTIIASLLKVLPFQPLLVYTADELAYRKRIIEKGLMSVFIRYMLALG
jgi:hypothetical protein